MTTVAQLIESIRQAFPDVHNVPTIVEGIEAMGNKINMLEDKQRPRCAANRSGFKWD